MAVTDITGSVLQFINDGPSRFIGASVDQPTTKYEDHTRSVLGRRTGWKLMARGSATISGFVSSSGTLKRIDVGSSRVYVTDPDLRLEYTFSSETHGEKWLEPGGVFVDNVWGHLHPTGRLVFSLHMEQGGQNLALSEVIFDTHDDRPNDFIKTRVAPLLGDKLRSLLSEHLGLPIH